MEKWKIKDRDHRMGEKYNKRKDSWAAYLTELMEVIRYRETDERTGKPHIRRKQRELIEAIQ